MLNHDSQVFTFSLPHFPIKNPMILTTGPQMCTGLGGLRNSQIHNRLKYNGENFKTESKRVENLNMTVTHCKHSRYKQKRLLPETKSRHAIFGP
jgi:hypothetical protein